MNWAGLEVMDHGMYQWDWMVVLTAGFLIFRVLKWGVWSDIVGSGIGNAVVAAFGTFVVDSIFSWV